METYSLNSQHFRRVQELPVPERYRYFVSRVADWEAAWALEDDDRLVAGAADDGVVHLPLWPHPVFAEAFSVERKAKPVAIPILELLEKLLLRLHERGHKVLIMPGGKLSGASVDPLKLKEDLERELEQYE